MDRNEPMDNWMSDDGNESPDCDQTSDTEESQTATFSTSRLRPAGCSLTFVPFTNWNPEQSYEGDQAIRYNVEWKVSINNRERAGESELGLVISPQKFWKHVLQPKVTAETLKKPCEADETKLVLAVSDRKTHNIKKRFPKLDVDWRYVNKQVQEWSKFLKDGKKITLNINISCHYVDTGISKTTPAGRGAKAAQNAEREAIISAEKEVLGRPACHRKAFLLTRCPGTPRCTKKSTHCWEDCEGKHFPLFPHHIRMIADYMSAGNAFNGHSDIPDNMRQMLLDEEREREENRRKESKQEQTCKRRRRDSDGSSISCNRCHSASNVPATPTIVFTNSLDVKSGELREDQVKSYTEFEQAQVGTEEQKDYIGLAGDLTLAKCYTLDMIKSNQGRMHKFYTENGVPDGIAWHYVCDIPSFQNQRSASM